MSVQCYMCQAPATGREHVPPRCFFPETKDLPQGVDLRKNLISVPSCDRHNTKKSKDDEYLAYVVVMHHENNGVAGNHIRTKVLRALQGRPSLRGFFQTQRPVLLDGAQSIAFKLNYSRVRQGLDYMARALYFHTYMEQWLAPMGVYTPAVYEFDAANGSSLHATKRFMHTLVSTHLADEPRQGKNQEVFWYQPWRDQQREIVLINMCFYEGASIVALSSPRLKL